MLIEPVALERAEDTAHVARVEVKARAQRPYFAVAAPDLPEHAGLAERPAAAEEVVVESAHPLGDRAVEAAHLLDGVAHSL